MPDPESPQISVPVAPAAPVVSQPIEGWFIVAADPSNPKDILFQLTSKATKQMPGELMLLMDEISRTLSVLQLLYEKDDKKFFAFHRRLLALARAGLVGATAQPAAARSVLRELKDSVVVSEAGNVKNRYMKALGKNSLGFGGIAFVIGILLHAYAELTLVAHFFYLSGACMAGVWLSFGARKPRLAFEDLVVPEQDRLEPVIRLVFAGLLTIILGLVFTLEVVVVKLGTATSAQLGVDPRVAILIGLFCGFSEQVLSMKVSQQASKFLGGLSSENCSSSDGTKAD